VTTLHIREHDKATHYPKMGNRTRGLRHLRSLCPLLCACFCLLQLPRVRAAGVNPASDNQLRQAVKQAVELAHRGTNVDQLSMSDRNDLAEELSHIVGKTTQRISFYSFYNTDSSSDDGSVWVVVSGNSPLGSDELYGFESSDGVQQSSQKFNQLMSHLALSISNEKATSIARFFLGCCVRWAPGETVTDEIDLRHSVERYYVGIYGDVWRALEAGSQWWQGYEKSGVRLTPTIVVEGSVRRIMLQRLILSFGMHPQLQQWHVAVSSDGSVRVLAVQSIFPKQDRWLSYAFRTTLAPQIH
jgi:hypothetical protein